MSVNNRRTKLIFKILFGQLGVGIFVVLLALSILFYAEGYRINYRNMKLTQTGVLYISSFPRNVSVALNGRTKAHKTPYSENLIPDKYNVMVSKEGYSPWASYVKIESELVDDFKNVVLFKTNPEISNLDDERIKNKLNSPVDELAIKNSHGLANNSYEIWANGNLVTRFSEPISKAIWYPPDQEHIIYQQGLEIRVIEIAGTNDTLLVALDKDTSANFTTNDKGDQLYFIDGDQYKTAQIR